MKTESRCMHLILLPIHLLSLPTAHRLGHESASAFTLLKQRISKARFNFKGKWSKIGIGVDRAMTHVKWTLTTVASAGKGLEKARRDARTSCSWSGRPSRFTVFLHSLQSTLPILQRCQKLLRKSDSTLRGSEMQGLVERTFQNLASLALVRACVTCSWGRIILCCVGP